MSRHYSLSDLRVEISIELRNESGTDARFTTTELDVAIARATNILREYFWFTDVDSSQTWVADTYDYVYSFPIRRFEKVAFKSSSGPLRFAEDWYEPVDGTLTFLNDDHATGDTIYVWYERHPVPFPSDLTLSGNTDGSGTAFAINSSTNVVNWPSTGWAKIENEVVKVTAVDRENNQLTVVRGQLDTSAVGHATGSSISFINRVDKEVFFEGVKDLAIAYLNRMRIVDAPSAQVDGYVTIMREILESQRDWIRTHRMRQQRQPSSLVRGATPNRLRPRGR